MILKVAKKGSLRFAIMFVLGGAFKYVLFSLLFGEDIQFD